MKKWKTTENEERAANAAYEHEGNQDHDDNCEHEANPESCTNFFKEVRKS